MLFLFLPFFFVSFVLATAGVFKFKQKTLEVCFILGGIFGVIFGFMFFGKGFIYNLNHTINDFFYFFFTLVALLSLSVPIKIDFFFHPIINNILLLLAGCFCTSFFGSFASCAVITPAIINNNKNQTRFIQVLTLLFCILVVGNVAGAYSAFGDPPMVVGMMNGMSHQWIYANLSPISSAIILNLIGIYTAIVCVYRFWKKNQKIRSVAIFVFIFGLMLLFSKFIRFMFLKNYICFIPYPSIFKGYVPYGLVILFLIILGLKKTQKVQIKSQSSFFIILLVNFFFSIVKTKTPLIQVLILILIGGITVGSYFYNKKNCSYVQSQLFIREMFFVFFGLFFSCLPLFCLSEFSGVLFEIFSIILRQFSIDSSFYETSCSFVFCITSFLSGFLDNTPTFLVVSNMMGGVSSLMVSNTELLKAVSLGAVFGGAFTYIGNAPNLLVKHIGEENHVKMPGFFSYMIFSIFILIPCFYYYVSFSF